MEWLWPLAVAAATAALGYGVFRAFGRMAQGRGKAESRADAAEAGAEAREREDAAYREARGGDMRRALERVRARLRRPT